MRAGLEMAVQQEDWKNAAMYASNLSQLELTPSWWSPDPRTRWRCATNYHRRLPELQDAEAARETASAISRDRQ
jgi:hypothetical protein